MEGTHLNIEKQNNIELLKEEEILKLKNAVAIKIENDKRALSGEVLYIVFDENIDEVFDVTDISQKIMTIPNQKKIKELKENHNNKKFIGFHNHTYTKEHIESGMGSIPSDHDFIGFLIDDDEKAMLIAQFDPEIKRVVGFYLFEKTNLTPKTGISICEEFCNCSTLEEMEEKSKNLIEEKGFRNSPIDDAIWDYRVKAFGKIRGVRPLMQRQEALNELADFAKLKVQYIPLEGYKYKEGEGFFPISS